MKGVKKTRRPADPIPRREPGKKKTLEEETERRERRSDPLCSIKGSRCKKVGETQFHRKDITVYAEGGNARGRGDEGGAYFWSSGGKNTFEHPCIERIWGWRGLEQPHGKEG